jgi:Protein of unknown function (DUF1822)
MTTAIREFSETYTDSLWLDFTVEERDSSWQQSRKDSSQDRVRYNAYLNRLCLNTVMAWLKEEEDELNLKSAQVWQPESLPAIWEMTTGTTITIGDTRIVLIPSEADDTSELSVPIEWVDIPEWVADYYVGVQIDPEECWVKIWGYASHKQLKEEGEYLNLNQTYSLLKSQLTEDIYIMLAGIEFSPITQAEVAPLPVLSAAEAEALIAQLGQPTPYSPRLDAPFKQWGALLSNDEWRSQLYQKRNAGIVKTSLIRLGEWLKGVTEESVEEVKTAWLTLEQLVKAEPQLALGHRSMKGINDQKVERWQVIDLDTDGGIRRLALLFTVRPDVDDTASLKVEVSSADDNVYLPLYLKLSAFDTSSETSFWKDSPEVKTTDILTIVGTIREIETVDRITVQLTLGEVSISKIIAL